MSAITPKAARQAMHRSLKGRPLAIKCRGGRRPLGAEPNLNRAFKAAKQQGA